MPSKTRRNSPNKQKSQSSLKVHERRDNDGWKKAMRSAVFARLPLHEKRYAAWLAAEKREASLPQLLNEDIVITIKQFDGNTFQVTVPRHSSIHTVKQNITTAQEGVPFASAIELFISGHEDPLQDENEIHEDKELLMLLRPCNDRSMLEALFQSTGGENWKHKEGWMTDADLTNWRGVRLDDDGRVVRLSLSGNNLVGELPAEIGGLHALKWLHLCYNELTGAIPAQVGQLAALESLMLNDNKLTGAIPEQFGDLTKLENVWLDENQLTGTIPVQVGQLTALQTLMLNHNQLTGTIPDQLFELRKLRKVDLSNNQLTRTGRKTLANGSVVIL